MIFEIEGQRFHWLEEKEILNIQAHGVNFQEAAYALACPGLVTFDDPIHSTAKEARYTGIGFTQELRLLRVTFRTMPENWLHIITAREASPMERKVYAQRNR